MKSKLFRLERFLFFRDFFTSCLLLLFHFKAGKFQILKSNPQAYLTFGIKILASSIQFAALAGTSKWLISCGGANNTQKDFKLYSQSKVETQLGQDEARKFNHHFCQVFGLK